MEIAGATALVTGATGGLGRAIATALHEAGARLLLSARKDDELAALAAELPGSQSVRCDLAARHDVRSLAAAAADVDIVVANAALPGTGALESFDEDDLDAVLDVNLRAPIVLTHALLPAMRARGRGHFVYIASISSKLATPRLSMYTASKFGLRGFALGLRQDLHGTGLSASLVHPGPIADAGMWVRAGVEPPRSTGPRKAGDVGRAVVRAVRDDKAELHVASPASRVGALVAEVAPDAFGALLRRSGSVGVAEDMAAGFRRQSGG